MSHASLFAERKTTFVSARDQIITSHQRHLRGHPHCQTTIIGTCNLAHLAENLEAATRGPLPVKFFSEITARVAKAT